MRRALMTTLGIVLFASYLLRQGPLRPAQGNCRSPAR